jgi:hypothetical protein
MGMVLPQSSGQTRSIGKMYSQRGNSNLEETSEMRQHYLLACVMAVTIAQAKEPKHYHSGKLLKMESVKCGTDEKNGKSLAGEVIGTDSSHMKTQELLCQQYTLETEELVYTVRPKEDKHPALLPVGEKAQFRLQKDKMLLRVEDLDDKEREYIVVSMIPKDSGEKTASSSRPSSNK